MSSNKVPAWGQASQEEMMEVKVKESLVAAIDAKTFMALVDIWCSSIKNSFRKLKKTPC